MHFFSKMPFNIINSINISPVGIKKCLKRWYVKNSGFINISLVGIRKRFYKLDMFPCWKQKVLKTAVMLIIPGLGAQELLTFPLWKSKSA